MRDCFRTKIKIASEQKHIFNKHPNVKWCQVFFCSRQIPELFNKQYFVDLQIFVNYIHLVLIEDRFDLNKKIHIKQQ
jgi:hypothetical protein